MMNVEYYIAPPKPRPNLNRDELLGLKNLRRDRSIVITKADKGNCTVILNKCDYDAKVQDVLSDNETYHRLKSDPTKCTEKRMNSCLLKMKRDGKLDQSLVVFQSFSLRSTDALLPRMYGLVKIHKEGYPVRPIVSFVNAATYALSKYLAKILAPLLNQSNRSVKNSFDFVNVVKGLHWRSGDVMVSFDVVSLFSCVPVELAISIIKKRLSSDSFLPSRTALGIDDIITLLEVCLNNSDFMFRGNIWHQKFGCPMGSPVSVIAANIVMEDIEDRIFQNSQFDVLCWRRFVDDTWVVLPESQVDSFFNFVNSIECSIKFTYEKEGENHNISFLDVYVCRMPNYRFKTSVFRKATHTNQYLNFYSNHPLCHKRSVCIGCSTRQRVSRMLCS